MLLVALVLSIDGDKVNRGESRLPCGVLFDGAMSMAVLQPLIGLSPRSSWRSRRQEKKACVLGACSCIVQDDRLIHPTSDIIMI
jgi:hypothetical protein